MRCNLNCEFCYYRFSKKEEYDWELIKNQLDKMKFYYNLEAVDITGGEPTVCSYIVNMVKYCKLIKLKPTIITNAQIPFIIEKCIDAGLDDLLISIHDLGKHYDEITKGSFKKLMKTVELCHKKRFKFRTNTVVTKHNLPRLTKIAKFIAEKVKPRIHNFIIFNPHEGTEWRDKVDEAKFQAKYSEIEPKLKKAIDILKKHKIWANVRYMPLCFMKGYEQHVCNFHQWQYDPYEWEYKSGWNLKKEDYEDIKEKAIAEGVFGTGDELIHNYIAKQNIKGNIFLNKCKHCVNRFICDGIYPQYARKFGLEEIKPLFGNIYIRDPMFYREPYRKYFSK